MVKSLGFKIFTNDETSLKMTSFFILKVTKRDDDILKVSWYIMIVDLKWTFKLTLDQNGFGSFLFVPTIPKVGLIH